MCETVLTWEDEVGQRFTFTAHDDEFCKGTMRSELLTLRRVLRDTQQWSAEREGSLHRQIAEMRGQEATDQRRERVRALIASDVPLDLDALRAEFEL